MQNLPIMGLLGGVAAKATTRRRKVHRLANVAIGVSIAALVAPLVLQRAPAVLSQSLGQTPAVSAP